MKNREPNGKFEYLLVGTASGAGAGLLVAQAIIYTFIVADQGTWATNPHVWLAIAFPILDIVFSISCYIVAWGHMPLNEKGQSVVEAVVHPILGVIAAVLCAITSVISEDPFAFGLWTVFLVVLVVLFVKHSLKSNTAQTMEEKER